MRRERGSLAAMRWALALFALSLLGMGATADAQAPSGWLAWRAPASCPDTEAIEGEVARLLGRPIDQALEPGFSASVRIAAERGALRARIRFEGSTDVRTVEGESCRTLADAIVVILAVAIDPERTAELLEAAAPATPTPERAPAEPPAPPPEAEPSYRVSIFLGAGVSAGALPAASAIFRLGAALDFGRVRVALAADYALRRDAVYVDAVGTYGGSFDLVGGGVDGCFALVQTSKIALPACVRFELGRMGGTGLGITNPTTGAALWIAAGGSVTFAYRIVPLFGLWISVEGVVGLLRPAFGIDEIGEIYRAGAGDFRGLAGLGVHF